jgi:flagellar basal body-associated protein FliL
MADEATTQAPANKGGGLKIVLIIVILLIVGGAVTAWILLKPTPEPELHSITWPGEGGHGGGEPLQLTCTLSDGSFHLVADIRLETVPVDLEVHGKEIEEEFAAKKSLIQGILTEVANSLDQTSVHKIKEFKSRSLKHLNEKLTMVEIEDVITENWMVQPAE